jgi:hypothetical protein
MPADFILNIYRDPEIDHNVHEKAHMSDGPPTPALALSYNMMSSQYS